MVLGNTKLNDSALDMCCRDSMAASLDGWYPIRILSSSSVAVTEHDWGGLWSTVSTTGIVSASVRVPELAGNTPVSEAGEVFAGEVTISVRAPELAGICACDSFHL